MKKIKKVIFAVVLSLTLIAPYSNGINANVREKTINVNRSVFGDNLRASKKGEVCKKVKVDDGIKKTVKDTFVDKSKAGEEHIREENVEIDLEEVSKSEKIAKKIKNSFGVEAVYASDTTTQTKNRSDSTGTANIKLVVKYVISTYSGDEYARITKVTGKVTACNGSKVRFGSGVSMVSNKFVVAQWGKTKKAGTKNYRKEQTAGCSVGATWTFTPNDWLAVNIDMDCILGAKQTITLKRGNSKWTLTVSNNYK